MRVKRNLGTIVSIALMIGKTAFSQTVPVGAAGFDDHLRILQLQGKLGIEHSLMARPFFTSSINGTDSLFRVIDPALNYTPVRKNMFGTKSRLELLPGHVYAKFNTDRPYSWNQAGFIQAKGLQMLVSTGAYLSSGIFSVQLKPEYIYAGNPNFPGNTSYGAPTRGSYSKFFLGQSSARLSKWSVSVGLSTENIWWGPGIHNSLLMSSNAPGFAHFTFNTTKPVKTAIGNFEWQLIGGKLVEDTSLLLENKNLTTNYYNPASYDGSGYSGLYDPGHNWRYLNGLTITYSPKWVKGLFLSFNRVGYSYKQKLDSSEGYTFLQKYFPVLASVLRKNSPYGTPTGNHEIGYKQMASIAVRFVFPGAHTELYTEYGYGDNFTNLRDWNVDAPHATAYIIGIRKLKELKSENWLDISAEMTRMSEPVNYLLRTAGDWYSYQGGYTHQNRIIGAGVGKGNNSYTMKLGLLSGFSRVGIVIQGIQHGPTELIGGLTNFGIRDIKWNDLAIGLTAQKRFRKLIVSGELQSVTTKNYAWEKDNNRFNLYCFLTATYLW